MCASGKAASRAEMERELTDEPTHAGFQVVRKVGRNGGRKHRMPESTVESAKKLSF